MLDLEPAETDTHGVAGARWQHLPLRLLARPARRGGRSLGRSLLKRFRAVVPDRLRPCGRDGSWVPSGLSNERQDFGHRRADLLASIDLDQIALAVALDINHPPMWWWGFCAAHGSTRERCGASGAQPGIG